ncbi:MAG: imidazole glycerol phosphate synthase subunit HisH [Rhodospirillales bacterium]
MTAPAAGAVDVVIVDYGSGNLRSAEKAFRRAAADENINAEVTVTADPERAARATHIMLPGVGAFADCRRGLAAQNGMTEALEDVVRARGRPFLGVCVGMQLMAREGLEHGRTPGLNWLGGEVSALAPNGGGPKGADGGEAAAGTGAGLKIPHMGWNELSFTPGAHPILQGIEPGGDVYFVHSYVFRPDDAADILASTDYGGEFPAMVARDNLAGTQFHPEKSQAAGLKLIANFMRWRP